jgi:hypothetical protein
VTCTANVFALAVSGRPRANARVHAGTSKAADALTQRRTSTSRPAVRLLRFKERGGGPAHGEKQFGRDAETRGMHGWLGGQRLPPGDSRSCACPAMNPGARENQCALARQAVRHRSHSNEENR